MATDADDSIVSDPAGMWKILQGQYSSAFSTPKFNENENHIDNVCSVIYLNEFMHIEFNENDFIESISKISCNSAAGPDGFPPILLKIFKEIKISLYLVWRRSMASTEILLSLKTGFITPIHKGGSRKQPKNYRPVSL